jgi:protein-S-isoprenylcysteine O-methyltransferase Ste14
VETGPPPPPPSPEPLLPALLARVPDLVFRIGGAVFFLFVLAWRLSLYGKYETKLWAAETSVYALIVLAYVLRKRARERPKTNAEIIFPAINGPLPFAFMFLADHTLGDPRIAYALMLAGTLLAVSGYVFLGGSFSILVEARELRSGGPYRWIRHPVYLGQIVAMTGVVLYRFSWVAVAIELTFMAVQVTRAVLEERKLERAIPGYAAYRARTAMFLPLPGLVDLFCLGLAASLLLRHTTFTPDLWWHLALGEATLRDHAIPAVETFSWTAAGAPLASHSWLFDAIVAGLERASGLGLVELAAVSVCAVLFRLIVEIGRAFGASDLLAGAAALAFAVTSNAMLIARPQLVTYVFFAWLVVAHLRMAKGSRQILAAPLVLALWSNLHGGFLLGIAFLLGVAAWEQLEAWRGRDGARTRARTLVGLAALGVVLACLNPSGPRQFLNALENTPLTDPVHTHIDEWLPPELGSVPLLGPSIVLALLLAILVGAEASLYEIAALVGTLSLALSAWRNVPLFGIVGGPVLAAWATRVARRSAVVARIPEGRTSPLAGGLVLTSVVALGLAVLETAHPRDLLAEPAVRERSPVAAAAWIEGAGLKGRMFNPYNWGGFLLWRLPAHRVLIDSRMLPYRDLFLDAYLPIYLGNPGWRAKLAQLGPDWAIVERSEARGRLAALLRVDPAWRLVHADDLALVFVRRGGPNEHLPAAVER